jgi:positive regulator of sigma E activity
MTDNGTVISTKKGFAQVKVDCLLPCDDCRAHSLCIGNKKAPGQISVKNPLDAHPGDEVLIEIPEEQYGQSLIVLFGLLLLGSLAGMAAGYFLSSAVPLSSTESSFIGLACGLFAAGYWLVRYFQKKNQSTLYPIITNIIRKGDCHG